MRFSRRAELDGDRADAELTFWGRRLAKLTEAEAREALEFEQSKAEGSEQRSGSEFHDHRSKHGIAEG